MSWLDDDAYAEDRKGLENRLVFQRAVLVIGRLFQGPGLLGKVQDIPERFRGTPLFGPTDPLLDLRDDGLLLLLAGPGVPTVHAGPDQGASIESLLPRAASGAPFVLHLRGSASRSMAKGGISDDELRRHVQRTPSLPKFLQELAETRHFVMLGVEPEFFASLLPMWGEKTGPHYALLPHSDALPEPRLASASSSTCTSSP